MHRDSPVVLHDCLPVVVVFTVYPLIGSPRGPAGADNAVAPIVVAASARKQQNSPFVNSSMMRAWPVG